LINLAKTPESRFRLRALALFLGAALFSLTVPAWAQGPVEPPLLFGGPLSKTGRKDPPLDPLLPTGVRVASPAERPRLTEAPACSPRRPVCVHRSPGVAGEIALSGLRAIEQAYERLVLALGLPAPLPDYGRGTTDALDLYLERSPPAELTVGYEEVPGDYDRASAFCIVAARSGSLLERAATQCVAEAIALRLDASETPDLRRAYASHLWLSTGEPTSLDLEAIDELQSQPQRATAARDLSPTSAAAALTFEYLERKRSAVGPGVLATGLLALSASRTKGDAWLWNNEPDTLDVLRHSLGNNRAAFASLLGSLTVARAFLGDRDDGSHWPAFGWTGAFGKIRFDWSIRFSSLPRRLASTRPIEPTGAFYLWLDLDDVPLGASLAVQAEWEHPVPFKWEIVRVDKDGHELSRLDVPYQETGTSFEQRVLGLEAAAGLIVAAVNVGDTEIDYPFDPDIAPFEGQRCTIYLAKL
jgi:hypothetical protein